MQISKQQARLHETFETVAVVAVVPFLVWVASRERPLAPAERLGLGLLALGTLVVDGYLLAQFHAKRRSTLS